VHDFIDRAVMSGLFDHEKGAPAELQSGLADALIEKLGPDIRIAYGCAQGLHGNVGADGRFSYTVLLPNFSACMTGLLATNFGTSGDVRETGSSS
jgi:hypothetical protein